MKRRLTLQVFDKPSTTVEPVCLALKQYHDEVRVVAMRPNGSEYPAPFLVSFHANGTVERMCSVNTTLGFQLDADGRIIDLDFPPKK